MRESRSYGSVRGALSNERPYRDGSVQKLGGSCVEGQSRSIAEDRFDNVAGFGFEHTVVDS